jgi:phosphatidylinositol 4-kinase
MLIYFNSLLQPDSLKPTLDRIIKHIVESLSGKDKAFYEREFTFFENVTSISGKLKPFIKKSKLEKKVRQLSFYLK